MSAHAVDACLLFCLLNVPVEHWTPNWPRESTVMVRMASKAVRETVDKMRLPLDVSSNWHNLFNHRNNLSPQEHCNRAFGQIRVLSTVCLVTTLKLIDCGLQGQALQPLAAVLPQCPGLEHLDLSFNGIGDAGLQVVEASIAGCTAIKKLVVTCNFLGDDGATRLGSVLAHLTNLEYLDVARNGISGVGLSSIAQALPHCPKLSFLFINHNRTANDVESLRHVLPMCQALTMIDVSHTDLGMPGLMCLFEAMPYLRQMYIHSVGNPDIDFFAGMPVSHQGTDILTVAMVP